MEVREETARRLLPTLLSRDHQIAAGTGAGAGAGVGVKVVAAEVSRPASGEVSLWASYLVP